jgi:uncharacterized protein YcbX
MRVYGQDEIASCPEHSWLTLNATASTGDAILFDFRVGHRGGANSHPTRIRPQIYMTYLQDWYYDAVNFHAVHSSQFDGKQPYARKLMTRIDSNRFRRTLSNLHSAYGRTEVNAAQS